jgi:hypothetical protein
MMPQWFSMLSLVDAAFRLHQFAHNDTGRGGFYNDLDMVAVGNPGDFTSVDQDLGTRNRIIAHLTMWIVLKAPILLSTPVENLSANMLKLLMDAEALSIHQDSWGRQARRMASAAPRNSSTGGSGGGALMSAPYDAQVALLPCNAGNERQRWWFNASDVTSWTTSGGGKQRWCLATPAHYHGPIRSTFSPATTPSTGTATARTTAGTPSRATLSRAGRLPTRPA